jgi:hypothetical protein
MFSSLSFDLFSVPSVFLVLFRFYYLLTSLEPLLLWWLWPRNYNNEHSSGHVREGSMCLQLPVLTAIINIEIAPKKENWIAQHWEQGVPHVCKFQQNADKSAKTYRWSN